MDYRSLIERITRAVDKDAYLAPSKSVHPRQRAALEEIERARQTPGMDPDRHRALILRFYEERRIDRVMMLSALHVLAASPQVQDWDEAARLTGEQEMAALELGGPHLQDNLASVERHRGVLAFLRGHYDLALDYFTRAFERQRSAENVGNILCVLIRLGELEEAADLLDQVRTAFPDSLVEELDERIALDPDLALLRTEGP